MNIKSDFGCFCVNFFSVQFWSLTDRVVSVLYLMLLLRNHCVASATVEFCFLLAVFF